MSQAKDEIRKVLSSDPGHTWTVRDIQELLSDWRGTIIHLALLDMARHDELVLSGDLTIEATTDTV